MKRYFHELADSTVRKIVKSGITYGELMNRYKQPDWCEYPEALNGVMGCWSLMDTMNLRHKISREYCKGCDCYKPEVEPIGE